MAGWLTADRQGLSNAGTNSGCRTHGNLLKLSFPAHIVSVSTSRLPCCAPLESSNSADMNALKRPRLSNQSATIWQQGPVQSSIATVCCWLSRSDNLQMTVRHDQTDATHPPEVKTVLLKLPPVSQLPCCPVLILRQSKQALPLQQCYCRTVHVLQLVHA